MKPIEERAKEYSTCDEDCALCSEVCRKTSNERAFTDGAEWMCDELTRWHYPKEKLPDGDQEVLCVIHKKYNTYAVLKYYQGEWWQPAPVPAGGWCGYDGDILGWREINEDTKSSNESK